jgi:hypothetical protein
MWNEEYQLLPANQNLFQDHNIFLTLCLWMKLMTILFLKEFIIKISEILIFATPNAKESCKIKRLKTLPN